MKKMQETTVYGEKIGRNDAGRLLRIFGTGMFCVFLLFFAPLRVLAREEPAVITTVWNYGALCQNILLARGDEEGLEEELAILRHLSSQVAGLTEEGEEAPLSVTWDDSQIDIHTAGTYELTGTISVPPEAAGQYVLPGSCSTIRNSVRVYAEEGLTLALSNEQTGGLSYAGAGKPWDL